MAKPINQQRTAALRRLIGEIGPILADQPPEIQGAALADLLAMWLAGFYCPDAADDTAALREKMLLMHVEHVRKLIPIHAEMLEARG